MKRDLFDGEPASATFWWAKRLCGKCAKCGWRDEEGGAERGSSVESYVLSAVIGLAAGGLVWALLTPMVGFWAWVLLAPATLVGLHLLLLAWVLIGALLQRLGLLAAPRRAAFHGAAIGASIAVAGVVAWAPFALPWVAFVLLEIVAWPARKLWLITGEEEA